MNALPIEPNTPLKDTLDDLISDYGLRHVVLALLSRLAKRTRPPDTKVELRAKDVRQLDLLSDHLRADLGLPPASPCRTYVDLHALWIRSH
ncbi:MAG: hypothetical protein ABJN34_02935 [Litoreibacter sp.]|uniref:hypothetical protein n=1 Tax=Litoreibacter sp. TaxID=1969459 RepID=UPI0032982885